jgi:hypothetical protein
MRHGVRPALIALALFLLLLQVVGHTLLAVSAHKSRWPRPPRSPDHTSALAEPNQQSSHSVYLLSVCFAYDLLCASSLIEYACACLLIE